VGGFEKMRLRWLADLIVQTDTAAPIYICAALYIVMAGVAAVFPFEPFGRRSS